MRRRRSKGKYYKRVWGRCGDKQGGEGAKSVGTKRLIAFSHFPLNLNKLKMPTAKDHSTIAIACMGTPLGAAGPLPPESEHCIASTQAFRFKCPHETCEHEVHSFEDRSRPQISVRLPFCQLKQLKFLGAGRGCDRTVHESTGK